MSMLTHWPGCWITPGHHSCAKERARALQAELEKMRSILQEIYDEATGDKGWDIVETAAKDALGEE